MRTFVYLFLCCIWTAGVFAQCPNFPAVNYFDTTCYRPLPDEIKVGQGRLGHAELWGTEIASRNFDFYIPAGREGWAISVVHAWQVQRNVLKYSEDVFNWHSFFGTMLKESFGACDPNLNFGGLTRCSGAALDRPFIELDNYTINTFPGSLARTDGCFQIDVNTGWPIFPKYYPHRFNAVAQHTQFMAEDNFETAALSKMYYELAFLRLKEYVMGHPVEEVLTTTPDPSAGTIWNARAYNRGFFDGPVETVMGNVAARTEAMGSNDWLTLGNVPEMGYDYTRSIAHVTRVLSNNYEGGWTRPWNGVGWNNTASNQWHCWFNRPISWAIMEDYMNNFFPLYPEVNPAEVRAQVQEVFNSINGGAPVSFRFEFAPVLDAFILAMPYDDPMQAWLYSTDGFSGCGKGSGCIGPAVTITPQGPLHFCQGLSVDLETVIGSGYTYQWLRDGNPVAHQGPESHIFRATQSGNYSVRVTNSSGCTTESECTITVVVENCSSCDMVATASGTDNSCSGTPDGSVSVSLTNAPFPVSYQWTGPVSGTTPSMDDVPDGTYVVEVTRDSDPTCRAFAQVTLRPAETLYQSLVITTDSIGCSTTDITAQMVNQPPASCEYRLRLRHMGGSCWGFWDNSQLNIMVTANGTNLGVPNPRANGGGDCVHLDEPMLIPHNADIGITILRLAGSNVSGPNFRLELVDPDGNTAFTYSFNGVNFTTTLTDIYSGTADCSVPSPVYTMTFDPLTELNAITTGVNTLSGRASVSEDRVYTITAQHPVLSACSISQQVLVENECDDGLPVEWLAFDATATDGRVHLKWATASEVNTRHFVIERSRDGMLFEPMGTVPAAGNSSSIQTYTYTDTPPYQGTIYYRLQQTDLDDSHRYSPTRAVTLDGRCPFRLYPNPFQEHFFVVSDCHSNSEPLYWELRDLAGNRLDAGVHTSEEPLAAGAQLPDGFYLLQLQAGEQVQVFKVVKQ